MSTTPIRRDGAPGDPEAKPVFVFASDLNSLKVTLNLAASSRWWGRVFVHYHPITCQEVQMLSKLWRSQGGRWFRESLMTSLGSQSREDFVGMRGDFKEVTIEDAATWFVELWDGWDDDPASVPREIESYLASMDADKTTVLSARSGPRAMVSVNMHIDNDSAGTSESIAISRRPQHNEHEVRPDLTLPLEKQSLPGTPENLMDELAAKLTRANQPKSAALVRLLRDHKMVSYEDVASIVIGDKDATTDAIRGLRKRANKAAEALASRVRFKCAGGHIHREIPPE